MLNTKMKHIIILATFLVVFVRVRCQVHYIPAQIFIPVLNNSAIQGLHNNSIANKTSAWSYNGTGLLNQTTSDGSLFVGKIGNQDRLLFNQIYVKPSRWWSGREKIIEYPKDVPDGYIRHETISAVRVYNQFHGGYGSKAFIAAGGPGYKYVKIILQSTKGNGFKYLVQVFGH